MTHPSKCLNSLEFRRNMVKLEMNSLTVKPTTFDYVKELIRIKVRARRIGSMWSILQEH